MARLYAVIALLVLGGRPLSLAAFEQSGVCQSPYCRCTPAKHPSWTDVNCTVPQDQKLDLLENSLPISTNDLIVTGAEALMFGSNSLSRLTDARRIYISGVKIILMRKFAAYDLNIINMNLDVENCDVLRIEERTFSNIKGPLSVNIKQCDSVSIDRMAFSWLLTMEIANVPHLQLASGSFMLDPTAANVKEHGPGMTINLKNLTVPEFAAQTFGSSAAAIMMENVKVRAIRAGAFSANTYNIVTATNCSFHEIEGESFLQTSLINKLHFHGCKIHQMASRALQSAVEMLNISHSKIENIETSALNTTVATVTVIDNEINIFKERGFDISSWNIFQMERNSFDEMAPYAIVAPTASVHEFTFAENEMETVNEHSLGFIGQAYANNPRNVKYINNYYGQPCHCNVTSWLDKILDAKSGEPFLTESFCTVDTFFARCFNVPEQNMVFKKFLDGVCSRDNNIKCESYKSKTEGTVTEIKNPRFPHKTKEQENISDRDKKVIGIVIVTCLGCVIIVMFISFVRWMRRKGYCVNIKNFLISSNSSCGNFCDRFCACGLNSGLDNARSISQLSVNEYSERHRLNEPRVQDAIQETPLPQMYTEEVVPVEDKTTQTLPEELTKELLENLKEKLEDPENYVEAREMIEHLYELIKTEESCNANTSPTRNVEENIYELPFQNTTPRIGRNKKEMKSIGTRAPSLEKLLPLSPYNRQTALVHEYFEPKDFAVHLYAEIANCDKDKRTLLSTMPDVIAEQALPRGPYLRAAREKMNLGATTSPVTKSLGTPIINPQHTSTIKSNKSVTSNSSGKMMNRPLPEKPSGGGADPGEGTSLKHG